MMARHPVASVRLPSQTERLRITRDDKIVGKYHEIITGRYELKCFSFFVFCFDVRIVRRTCRIKI